MKQAPKRLLAGRLYDMDIAKLCTDPAQPRKYFDEQALSGLTTSIGKLGVLQPVLVRSCDDDKFMLVSGERRYHASLAAGRTTIPVILTKGDPVEISIVENLLRENLTAIEEAEAIDRLRNSHQYQLTDLAGILGKAESTISEILSLNKLPETIKDDCRSDPKAPRGILAAIAKQKTSDKMHALYEKYKASGLTRGEIRGKRMTLKRAASEAAQATATKSDVTPPVSPDFGFIGKCTKRLNTFEIEKLDRSQNAALMVELDLLRLAIRSKFKVLKAALGNQ